MAKPIKETPVLKGKDAVNFVNNQRDCARETITQNERDRMRENYMKLQSLVVHNVSR